MNRYKLVSGVVLFYSCVVWSQQTMLLNHAGYDLMLLSPAAAVFKENVSLACHYKKNWTGMPASPELSLVNFSWKPASSGLALGASIAGENAGMLSRQGFNGIAAYQARLSARQFLSFGMAGGFQRQAINFEAIRADAPAEFAGWPQQLTYVVPDVTFGIAYNFRNFFLTGSAKHLLSRPYRYETSMGTERLYFKTLPVITLAAQQRIVLARDILGLLIHLSARSTQGLPVQPDLYGGLEYKDLLFFGGGYRHELAVYAMLGVRLSEKVRLFYAFEHGRGMQYAAKGGHELSIQVGSFSSGKKDRQEAHRTQENFEEIFEKIDQQEAEMERLKKRADSVDRNMALVREELDKLKAQQLSKEELIQAIDHYFDQRDDNTDKTNEKKRELKAAGGQPRESYRIISPKTESDFEIPEDTVQAGYKLVLGVYQVAGYARQYQQFLRREGKLETRLVQLSGHPRNYIYVCSTEEFDSLRAALSALKNLRADLKHKQPPLTKGEAWILQTVKQQP